MVPLGSRYLKIRVATADRDESYVSRDRSKLYRRGYSERTRERERESPPGIYANGRMRFFRCFFVSSCATRTCVHLRAPTTASMKKMSRSCGLPRRLAYSPRFVSESLLGSSTRAIYRATRRKSSRLLTLSLRSASMADASKNNGPGEGARTAFGPKPRSL